MADDPPASASAEPTATPAAATSSPADSQPNTVVVTSIDPVIQLPQLEEIFSAIGQLVSIRWYEPPTGGSGGERVCLLEYEDAGQASSALIISDMHIVLGSREISVRKWDDWWQQQQDELAKKQQQHQQHQAALAAATAAAAAAAIVTTQSSASPISSTSSPPAAVSLSDPSSIASAALAAAQLAQSLSAANPAPSLSLPQQLAATYDPNLTTIYVGNLAPPVTEEILTAYFSQVGPLSAVRLQGDGSLSPNRFAFVEFVEVEKANMALNLHGQLLLNRPMKVGKASTPITNRALMGLPVVGGGVVLGDGSGSGSSGLERLARLQAVAGSGAVSSDKVVAALARVAQAQQLIANKFGVKVAASATAVIPALTAMLPPSTATAENVTALEAGGSKDVIIERKRSVSRSRSRSRSRSPDRNRRQRRSISHSRSRSPSISRSRSPSHSRSRSRSPAHRQHRVRRWSRERDSRGRRGGGGRRRNNRSSEERRDSRRYGRRRSFSRSPSPRPARRVSVERRKETDMVVGADRWRAGVQTADDEEKKASGEEEMKEDAVLKDDRGKDTGRERDANRESDRYRDDRRRERSRSRERPRGRDHHQRSSRPGRRRHSSDSGDEEFVHRRAREHGGQRNRYKKNTAGREGLQWDGYQWVAAVNAAQPNVAATAPGVGK